jgi:hypothetical protein
MDTVLQHEARANNRMHWSVRTGRFKMENQLRTPRDAGRSAAGCVLMKQSWFGIGSCLAFVSAVTLAVIAWLAVIALKPAQPSHMDMSGVAILFVVAIAGVVITIVQLVGVVLGIVGLRQAAIARSAAHVGTVLNGVGLLCSIIATLVLCYRFTH